MAKTHKGDWAELMGGVAAIPAAVGVAAAETWRTGSLKSGLVEGIELAKLSGQAAGRFVDNHHQGISEVTDVVGEVAGAVLKVLTLGYRADSAR